MSTLDEAEMYTDELALSVQDESLRFQRKVRSNVLSNAAVIAVAAIFFGLFSKTLELQRGLSVAVRNPELVMAPASGSVLTTAFSALLAVILAVWFAPTTFRLGASESPSTIARELASKSVVAVIARLCGLLSISVAVWSWWSAAISDGPPRVEIMRMILPVLLGLGFAYWAAVAEVRLGELSNHKLRWAAHRREAERLRQVIAGDSSVSLSKSARILQRFVAFGVMPVVVWIVGLLIIPSPSGAATVARLLMVGAVNLVGYFTLCKLTYRLIGRQIAPALFHVFTLVLAGTLMLLTTSSAALPSGVTENALHFAPIARSMLLFGAAILSGPFVVLTVLAVRLPLVNRRGVILDSVMNRYAKELAKVEEAIALTESAQANRPVQPGEVAKPFAWVGLVALLPIAPFNVMFGVLALRLIREDRARGRIVVIAAIVIGVIVTVVGVCALVYAELSDPTLVFCDPDSAAVCLRSAVSR